MKLWKVTIERELMVVAEDESQAERIALQHEREESFNDPDFVIASSVRSEADIPHAWRGCPPYGGEAELKSCEEVLRGATA